MDRIAKVVLLCTLFLIFMSIHMQFPVFTPLAVSLGAGSFAIGAVLSVTSFVNLGGNIFAGTYIDRYGVKWFIIVPLFFLTISFYAHSFIEVTEHLFLLRIVNGFILAFLTPACMTLLSSFGKSSEQQSRNMALNTLIVTLAMIFAPFIGGLLGERLGVSKTYTVISFATAIAFLLSIYFLRLPRPIKRRKSDSKGILHLFSYPPLFPVFLTGFGIMFAQGTLMYELPFISVEHHVTKGDVGKMAGYIGVGTLFILCFTFLHRFSAKIRCLCGLMLMAFSLFTILIHTGIPTFVHLFLFGCATGVVFPAMMTLVTESIHETERGKAFSFLSAIFSIGTISAPFIAGAIRETFSPYYVAWLVLMVVITLIGLLFFRVTTRDNLLQS